MIYRWCPILVAGAPRVGAACWWTMVGLEPSGCPFSRKPEAKRREGGFAGILAVGTQASDSLVSSKTLSLVRVLSRANQFPRIHASQRRSKTPTPLSCWTGAQTTSLEPTLKRPVGRERLFNAGVT